MITEQDLNQAIAECHGERNPDASTAIRLAAFYIIRNEMFGKTESSQEPMSYSFAAGPADTPSIDYDSGTEFAAAVNGRLMEDILPIFDEVMSTIQVLLPKLYDKAMAWLKA